MPCNEVRTSNAFLLCSFCEVVLNYFDIPLINIVLSYFLWLKTFVSFELLFRKEAMKKIFLLFDAYPKIHNYHIIAECVYFNFDLHILLLSCSLFWMLLYSKVTAVLQIKILCAHAYFWLYYRFGPFKMANPKWIGCTLKLCWARFKH